MASVDEIWGSKVEPTLSIVGILPRQHGLSGFLPLRAPIGEYGVQPCPPPSPSRAGLVKAETEGGGEGPARILHANHTSHRGLKPFPLSSKNVRRFSQHSLIPHPHPALETVCLPAGLVYFSGEDLFPATAAWGPLKNSDPQGRRRVRLGSNSS